MAGELTDRQREVLAYIVEHRRHFGYSPTTREIGEHFGIRSPNGVVCHLQALEKKGALKRVAKTGRTILPTSVDGVCPYCGK